MASDRNKANFHAVTPEQAARQIGFALSELSSENAHHEFEHLCRHLTRLRICPNIIPSTGPVSGGGDQGIDFETYPVSSSLNDGGFFARATDEKWIFACSLEKNVKRKIKKDLASAAKLRSKPDRLYFFHHLPIKTSDRHKLQSDALEVYGIGLDIMDSKAISELLAEPETVWIAERYLSLPSAFVLADSGESQNWYLDLLTEEDEATLTDGKFFKLRNAIREVAYAPKLRSDALKLFDKIRRYRSANSDRIRRKAIYEEFVASLRGLGDSTGYEEDLRLYLSTINILTDPADLEDAAAIVSYILGARVQEGLKISIAELEVWHSDLFERTESLLASTEHNARKCALSLTKASLQLSKGGLLASKDYHRRQEIIKSAAVDAIVTWRSIVKLSGEVPLFPVERIATIVDGLADLLDGLTGNTQLQNELDRILRKRSGTQSSITRHLNRATSFQGAGKLLRALDEIHLAQVDAIGVEDAVLLSLFLGKLYGALGLHFAAKHYVLSSAYAALKLPDERLRSLAYAGIAEAAASDYVCGGSVIMFLSAYIFILVANYYSMSGTEETRSFEWSRIEYHLVQVTYWSHFISGTLQKELLLQLDKLGTRGIYDELLPQIQRHFPEIKIIDDLDARMQSEGLSPLFCDVAGKRYVTWIQLRIQWQVSWPTIYQSERFSETFCAYLQIILAELTDLELSIMPGVANVELRFSSKETFEFEQVPDNTSVSRILWIPLGMNDFEEERELAIKVVYMFLDALSAEKQESLLEILGPRIAERTPKILSAYASNSRLFEEFYLEENYDSIYKAAAEYSGAARNPQPSPEHFDLSGPTGVHPSYKVNAIRKQIERRYEKIPPVIKYTLSRLKANNNFAATISDLRSEGWKDWHILLAIANVRLNYLYGFRGNEPSTTAAERMRLKFEEPELETDPMIPSEEVSTEALKRSLQLARLSTLTNWGLQVRQQTPNHHGVDALLQRFNYWTDDTEHSDFFE